MAFMPRSVDMSERGIRWLESRGRIAGADKPPIEVTFLRCLLKR